MTEEEFRTGIMNSNVDEQIATEAEEPKVILNQNHCGSGSNITADTVSINIPKPVAGAGVVAVSESTEALDVVKDATGNASGGLDSDYAKFLTV